MKRIAFVALVFSFSLFAKSIDPQAGTSKTDINEQLAPIHVSFGLTIFEQVRQNVVGPRVGVGFAVAGNFPLYLGVEAAYLADPGFLGIGSSDTNEQVQLHFATYVRPALGRVVALKFGLFAGPTLMINDGVADNALVFNGSLRGGIDFQFSKTFGMGLEWSVGGMTISNYDLYVESGLKFNLLF